MVNPTIIGQSPQLEAILRSTNIVSATDVNVLILGESGTGKELLAQSIHQNSCRHLQPYVSINCAALPDELAEAELFGYQKGAFTGADKSHIGRISQAEGGTLFLDEVGELSPKLQTKLLRFLESGECQPLGSDKNIFIDARIIAATNRDLLADVETGRFRQDLYYRLNVVPLRIPALRERSGDIKILLQHFFEYMAQQHGIPLPQLDKMAANCLNQYTWPGNVRELRNLCERLVILLQGQTVFVENLPHEIRQASGINNTVKGFLLPEQGLNLEQLEQNMIIQALDKTSGNRSRAARLLGLTRDTLLYRMKKYAMR